MGNPANKKGILAKRHELYEYLSKTTAKLDPSDCGGKGGHSNKTRMRQVYRVFIVQYVLATVAGCTRFGGEHLQQPVGVAPAHR